MELSVEKGRIGALGRRPPWLRERFRPTRLTAGLLLLGVLAACGDDVSGPGDELSGGVLATFDVQGEVFHVRVTNAGTIAQLLDLRDGLSVANIPIGPLLAGPGRGDHNSPWSWHLDPAETSMAELTIEVCSGLPSFVEADLDVWLNNVGSYCPWSAELAGLQDFR